MKKRNRLRKIIKFLAFSSISIGSVAVLDMVIFRSIYHPLVYAYNVASFFGCRNSPLPHCTQANFQLTQPTVTGNKGVVVTTQHEASKVGVRILSEGGNAIDAAVAVGYALAVTDPCCGNIGGGGFMLVHLASGKDVFINFREKAPLAATTNMYQGKQGKVIKGLSTKGYLAVGVPGTVAGLDYALSKFGTKNRASVMAPAIALANSGFVLQPGDIGILNAGQKRFAEQSNVAAIFLKNHKTSYRSGEVLVQKNLARTLNLIAEQGKDAFYRGTIADGVVKASKANGGILTKADFTNYKVTESQPVKCNYRGYEVISAPPPGGGTTLCQMLNILAGYPLKKLGWHSPKSLHLMLSAMLYAYADRNTYLGDPDFVKNPVERLLSKEYAASIRAKTPQLQAIPPSRAIPGIVSSEGTNTTHYSICDRYGNTVSVTYTINSYFGAGVIAGNSGFFLNNEMDDFAIKPGVANQFGLVQSSANAIEPGKRPLSSMSPTIVTKNDKVFLVTGSPGGSTIPTTVLQTITNVIDYGMSIKQAVDAPRFHYQGLPNIVITEPYALDSNSFQKLWEIGYKVVPFTSWGASESILVNPETNTFNGVNDPRKIAGKAVAY